MSWGKIVFCVGKILPPKKKVNLAFLKTLYFVWFYSLFNYGIIIWDGEYKSNLQPLISIQTHALN